MFFGEYQYRVDEKGRVPLPPKFRREIKDAAILTKGTEKCITVYPVAEWKRLAERLSSKVVSSVSQRKLNRAIFGSAFSTTFDGQGRMTLPLPLRDYAQLGDTIVIVGINNCVELWNEELWKAEKASAEEQAAQIMEDLGAQ